MTGTREQVGMVLERAQTRQRTFARDGSRSRLADVHAIAFASGITTLLVGLTGGLPSLLLLSGPCLMLSGALIWLGSRISFAGPVGEALRLALGRRRIVTLHARAILWMVLGVVVTIAGVHGLQERGDELPPRSPRLALPMSA